MPRSYETLTLGDEKRMLVAAEAKAASFGLPYNIAVVDAEGRAGRRNRRTTGDGRRVRQRLQHLKPASSSTPRASGSGTAPDRNMSLSQPHLLLTVGHTQPRPTLGVPPVVTGDQQ